MSQVQNCIGAAHHFLLSGEQAMAIFNHQKEVIENSWEETCDEALLNETDRKLLWNRQFLNPFVLYGLDE